MNDQPSGLIYGQNDMPPVNTTILLAGQHMIITVSYTIFAVMVVRQIGGSPAEVETVTTMALLAGAIGTFLQAVRSGPVGSGHLIAHISSAIYVPASLAAGMAGGLGLVWGMTLAAGLFEAVLSRLLFRMKRLFSQEVCGVVVTMVGFSLVHLAIKRFLGLDETDLLTEPREVVVALLTLSFLIGFSVSSRPALRLYSLIFSLAIGYLAAALLGVIGSPQFAEIAAAEWFAFPKFRHAGWRFDWAFLAPFLVAALAAAVKSTGLVVISQQEIDPQLTEPDPVNLGRGVMADAVGTICAGLLGTIGTNPSPTSVGVVKATGAVSIWIAFTAAGLTAATAFLPKLVTFISHLPGPVLGAVLVYAVCLITGSGLQMISRAGFEPKRVFLVGISMLSGLSVEIVPRFYDQLPDWGRLAFHSPITVAALTAIGMNLIFSIRRR